jgi:hypothetical protein
VAVKELAARDLEAVLAGVQRRIREPGRLYLLGSTSHLHAGWRPRVTQFDLAGEGEAALASAVRSAAEEAGAALVWEHPADVIPLPSGHGARARPTGVAWPGAGGAFEVMHFDPCSVILRAIARGDEPDYEVALTYLTHGWVTLDQLETILADTLPRFTNATIQQDPAEFRRKFRGLRQMWRASPAGRR